MEAITIIKQKVLMGAAVGQNKKNIRKSTYVLFAVLLMHCVSCKSTAQDDRNNIRLVNDFLEDVKNKDGDKLLDSYFELSDSGQMKLYEEQIISIYKKLSQYRKFEIINYESWNSKIKNKLHELEPNYSVYCVVFFDSQLQEKDVVYFCFHKNKLFSIVPLCKGNNIIGWLPGQRK